MTNFPHIISIGTKSFRAFSDREITISWSNVIEATHINHCHDDKTFTLSIIRMQPVEYYAYITQNIVLPEDIQKIYVINEPAVMGFN